MKLNKKWIVIFLLLVIGIGCLVSTLIKKRNVPDIWKDGMNDESLLKYYAQDISDVQTGDVEKNKIMINSVETDGKKVELQDYAIYPSTISERNEGETNQYLWNEINIDITCPQIYFSNAYVQYDSEIETTINKALFEQSLMDDDSFLVGRDMRGLVEYHMDYVISKANDYLFSIQYEGQLYSVNHGHNLCSGITIDIQTGERIDLSEIIVLDDTLVEKIKNGQIEYIDSAGYEEEYIIELLEEFLTNYQEGLLDTYSCYFLEDDLVNLIIPMSRGNSNYIVVKVPF